MNIKSILFSALIASPALLSAQSSYSVTADFPFVSDYVFRGINYAEDSIQPSLQFSSGNFYASIWTNQPVTGTTDNEFDYNLGYTFDLASGWALDLGATYYDYPETPGNVEQFEPYVGIAGEWDNGLSAGFTLFHETEFEVTTFTSNVGYSLGLDDDQSLDFGAELGSVMVSSGEDYTYWALSATLTRAFNEQASGYLGVTYSDTDLDETLNPEGRDIFVFTAGLSLGF